MAEALDKQGIALTHIIGPQTKHAYEPGAKREVDRRMASLAERGRQRNPEEIRFTTYTLKYNRAHWITIDGLQEHWKKARLEVNTWRDDGNNLELKTENVSALTVDIPPGNVPYSSQGTHVSIDDIFEEEVKPQSDQSLKLSFVKTNGTWSVGTLPAEGFHKKHDLQGPIDDAFMDSFLIVRPTGKSAHAKLQDWAAQEMTRAIEHWRRHFRGEARVKDDQQVSDADIAGANLILWGDAESNSVIKRIADRLPIQWTSAGIKAGDRSFDADNHALILIHPNPLNPSRYVVLNSGFTFRDYDYLNNARQVPKLPDWAVIDLRTPPDGRFPGKVVAADFFGESWELKPQKP